MKNINFNLIITVILLCFVCITSSAKEPNKILPTKSATILHVDTTSFLINCIYERKKGYIVLQFDHTEMVMTLCGSYLNENGNNFKKGDKIILSPRQAIKMGQIYPPKPRKPKTREWTA